jgi:hypothetical protein
MRKFSRTCITKPKDEVAHCWRTLAAQRKKQEERMVSVERFARTLIGHVSAFM